jgi:hypothetical protein
VSGVYVTHGDEKCMNSFGQKVLREETKQLGDLYANRILRWNKINIGARVWTGLIFS